MIKTWSVDWKWRGKLSTEFGFDKFEVPVVVGQEERARVAVPLLADADVDTLAPEI
jgi:hypothetical protein